jgi:2-succinyl-6-hydroxy-2,4-cyclohexadiene-1-carboxylate synthase
MGGQISLLAALARPDLVRSLTTIGAGPCRAVTEERERRSWERAAEFFETTDAKPLANALANAAPVAAEMLAERPDLAPERLYAGARGTDLARIIRGGFLGVESNDDACRTLAVPVLVIAGERDETWLEPSRRLAELAPRGELLVVADAGHLAHLERRETCAREIAAFLAARFSGASSSSR